MVLGPVAHERRGVPPKFPALHKGRDTFLPYNKPKVQREPPLIITQTYHEIVYVIYTHFVNNTRKQYALFFNFSCPRKNILNIAHNYLEYRLFFSGCENGNSL